MTKSEIRALIQNAVDNQTDFLTRLMGSISFAKYHEPPKSTIKEVIEESVTALHRKMVLGRVEELLNLGTTGWLKDYVDNRIATLRKDLENG